MNRLTHFVMVGGPERISPNPFFDTAYYLDRYPDVLASGHNPLLHFLIWGSNEGRRIHSDFDIATYQVHCPDCPAHAADALRYICTNETAEGFFARNNPWIKIDYAAKESQYRRWFDAIWTMEEYESNRHLLEQVAARANAAE